MDASYIPMFVFLLVGACCNLPFFVRSVRDLCRTSTFTAMPAAPSALLTTALCSRRTVLPSGEIFVKALDETMAQDAAHALAKALYLV